jgi:hypothetical protein
MPWCVTAESLETELSAFASLSAVDGLTEVTAASRLLLGLWQGSAGPKANLEGNPSFRFENAALLVSSRLSLPGLIGGSACGWTADSRAIVPRRNVWIF